MSNVANESKTKRRGLYYGWVIVRTMTVITGVAITMGSANFGFFVKPMRDELGFSLADFGWMNTTRVLTAAMSSVFLGRLLDKYGPRWLLAVIGLLVGALMVLMGAVNHVWESIGIFALFGFLGLTGGSSLLMSTTPAKWFGAKRAKAMAYVYLGVPLEIMFFYPITQALIDAYGWSASIQRATALCLACVVKERMRLITFVLLRSLRNLVDQLREAHAPLDGIIPHKG